MEKSYFDNEPKLLTNEGKDVLVCFDIEHVTEERTPSDGGEAEQVSVIRAYAVRVSHPLDRGKVVDAIVTAMYPSDKMQAVVNNYLLEPDDEDRKADFEAMQAWRVKAKGIATDVINAINE